ncbi:MAG: PilZ domain-containing protein [Terriglobia bacterium]|jgi:hypothetical protein
MRKVRPRPVGGEKQSLLVVFKDTPQEQNASLKLPSRYTKATDLRSEAARVVVDHSVSVTVSCQDMLVVLLESQTAPTGGGCLGKTLADGGPSNLVAISRRRNYTPVMVKNRRRAPRYSAHLKASLRLPAEGTTFGVIVEDLAVLGCLLEYAPWLQARQECELAVEWKGREFRTPAVVVWKNVQGKAGLEFGNNDPASQALLREICAELRLKPLVRLPEDLE